MLYCAAPGFIWRKFQENDFETPYFVPSSEKEMYEETGYSELVKALCSTSDNLFLPLTLLRDFGIFVCSKGNNKANTVMLNQLPAYIWVHAKHSIPSMAFCGIINSFLKMQREIP